MRLLVAAVGKLKDAEERAISERYIKRFKGAGRTAGLGPVEIAELMEARGGSEKARRDDEAARLAKAAAVSQYRIALDAAGKSLSSESFAAEIARLRDDGIKTLAFLIGGPDGHGQQSLSEAQLILSLGSMTLPHGLARIVLLEQLYRAATILTGHPYHRA